MLMNLGRAEEIKCELVKLVGEVTIMLGIESTLTSVDTLTVSATNFEGVTRLVNDRHCTHDELMSYMVEVFESEIKLGFDPFDPVEDADNPRKHLIEAPGVCPSCKVKMDLNVFTQTFACPSCKRKLTAELFQSCLDWKGRGKAFYAVDVLGEFKMLWGRDSLNRNGGRPRPTVKKSSVEQ